MTGKSQAKKKLKPRGNPLSDMLLKIGRLLSPAKAKDPDLYEVWTSILNLNNIKTSDRILELIAWDVQNNGQNLGSYDMLKREGSVQKKFNEMAEIEEMAKIAKQQIVNNVNAEVEHQRQMAEMNAVYLQNLQQTQNVMSDLQRQMQELKKTK